MRDDISPPFAVYEDDCTATDDFQPVIDVPDAASVLYLGVSTWGSFPEVTPQGISRGTIATRFNDELLRVHNMLSGHAMVFLTREFVEAAKNRTIKQLVCGMHFDQGMAELQRQFVALTPNRPMFFQDRSFGGMERATRNPLMPISGPVEITHNNEAFVVWVQDSQLTIQRKDSISDSGAPRGCECLANREGEAPAEP